MSERDRRTGSTAPMVVCDPRDIQRRGRGQTLASWLLQHGCDQRTVNQIVARRFAVGSYRPSDRAALRWDSSPTLTPYADGPLATAAEG